MNRIASERLHLSNPDFTQINQMVCFSGDYQEDYWLVLKRDVAWEKRGVLKLKGTFLAGHYLPVLTSMEKCHCYSVSWILKIYLSNAVHCVTNVFVIPRSLILNWNTWNFTNTCIKSISDVAMQHVLLRVALMWPWVQGCVAVLVTMRIQELYSWPQCASSV